jgi:hypothetical protein
LADPTTANWNLSPLDAMAVLQTPQDAAFDRWFIAALERKDTPLALDVAEKTKRRRFLAALPLGGRLLALRTLLEAPQNTLSRDALLQRQQLLASFPAYQQLADSGANAFDTLQAGPVLAVDPAEKKSLDAQYDAWERNAAQRQQLLMQLAARRLPSSLEFPPLRTATDLQQGFGEGEALVVFHSAAGDLHGFLVTPAGIHRWQIGDVRRLRAGVADFLRALGNYGPNRAMSAEELSSDRWRKVAAEAYPAVFSDARLDLTKTTALSIVPDDLLWYLPFEALVPEAAQPASTLGDRVALRYGPTAALAMSNPRTLRRTQHTGIVANDLSLGASESDTKEMLSELEKAVIGPLRLPTPLPVPGHLVTALLDTLVVLDDVDPARVTPSNALPVPRGRGNAGDAADVALVLPYGGPEHVIVTGFATAAEQGLKPSRRDSARDVRPGSEVFRALCGMMASGARTVLLSRWRTGGRTNLELVREYVRELPQVSATDAWQRACLLARESPLDTQNEPRLKGLEETSEPPTANHPFFWAGYLLVDTSPRPEEMEPADDVETKAASSQEEKKDLSPSKQDETATDPHQATSGSDADASTVDSNENRDATPK